MATLMRRKSRVLDEYYGHMEQSANPESVPTYNLTGSSPYYANRLVGSPTYSSVTGTGAPIDPSVDYDQFQRESIIDRYKPFGMLGTGHGHGIRWAFETDNGKAKRTGGSDIDYVGFSGEGFSGGVGVDWQLGSKQSTYGTPEYYRNLYRSNFVPTVYDDQTLGRIQSKKGSAYTESIINAQSEQGFVTREDYKTADLARLKERNPAEYARQTTPQAYRPLDLYTRTTSTPREGLRGPDRGYFSVPTYGQNERLAPLSEGGGEIRGPSINITRTKNAPKYGSAEYAFVTGKTNTLWSGRESQKYDTMVRSALKDRWW